MKDLYTFDRTIEDAKETYDSVSQAYDKVFKGLGVPFVKGNNHWKFCGNVAVTEVF